MSYLYYEIRKLFKWEMLGAGVFSAILKIFSLVLVYYCFF